MASKSYRTTISIPQDLKEQMDATADQVNWSAVAAQAFKVKLAEIASRRARTMSDEDIVKRMRAVKEAEDGEDREEGKAAGSEWATRWAKPRQLKRLERLSEGQDWDSYFEEDGSSA